MENLEDANPGDDEEYTPLHVAAQFGQIEVRVLKS